MLLLHVTSGNALMAQVNNRVITGAACGEGESRQYFIKGWGEQLKRYRGGGEIWRTEEAGGENVQGAEGVCWDNSSDGGTWWEQEDSLSEPLNVLHCWGPSLPASVQMCFRGRGGGIGEEFDDVQRYHSIFTRSCYQPTSLLLPSLPLSPWSHLKCQSMDTVRTKHTDMQSKR